MAVEIYSSISKSSDCFFNKEKFKKSYEKLLKCGFSPDRSLHGLVATGLKSEREASRWLASHIDDKELNNEMTRDYYVFLCPQDKQHEIITDFWDECKKKVGWNLAHDYPPHVTILPQFQVADKYVGDMCQIIVNRFLSWCNNLNKTKNDKVRPMEPLTNCDQLEFKKNFLGFQFVGESRDSLDQLSRRLLADLDELGIVMDENMRQSKRGIFYLSLAYGFSATQHSTLSNIVKSFDETVLSELSSLFTWKLCLFSCDSRLREIEEVFHTKTESSESSDKNSLSWEAGDLIGSMGNSKDINPGLVYGINLNTGQTGLLVQPPSSLMCPQSNAWTKILEIPMQSNSLNAHFSSTMSNPSESISNQKFHRRVIVMRHGERIDFCFKNWISRCFDNNGLYRRHNLNMPPILPVATRQPEDFFHDSPLTLLGLRVSRDTGQALKTVGIEFNVCYSSPALRCVQTATEVLKGLNAHQVEIRIEPLLFEWMGWYKNKRPKFLSPTELSNCGFPIDTRYKAISKLEDLNDSESLSQYYERKGRLVKKIMDNNKKKGTSVLLLGHAASLDVCTRPLICSSRSSLSSHSHNSWPPHHISQEEFHFKSLPVPFCGSLLVQQNSHATGSSHWKVIGAPIPTFAHTKCPEFDWKAVFPPS